MVALKDELQTLWLVASSRQVRVRDGYDKTDPMLDVGSKPVKITRRKYSDFEGDPEVQVFRTEDEAKAFSAERDKGLDEQEERKKRAKAKVERDRAAFREQMGARDPSRPITAGSPKPRESDALSDPSRPGIASPPKPPAPPQPAKPRGLRDD